MVTRYESEDLAVCGCGEKPQVVKVNALGFNKRYYSEWSVRCGCGMQTQPYESENAAKEAWNYARK